MIEILSVENMRESEENAFRYGVTAAELMSRAGEGVYKRVKWIPPVAVVCGSGNNAGDGYRLAALLADNGTEVAVFTLGDRFTDCGKFYFDECVKAGAKVVPFTENADLSKFGTVVDCIFGVGFKGEIKGLEKTAVEKINSSGAYVVSVDINSGLSGNGGVGELCVVSDLTVSIGRYKPAHFLGRAKDVIKSKTNCDIGLGSVRPYFAVGGKDVRKIIPDRLNFSHKGDYGYIAIIGGSLRYSGAVRLADLAAAAMRAGAGVVKVAAPKTICGGMVGQVLESTLFPLSDDGENIIFSEKEAEELLRGVRTVAFGPGIGVTEENEKFLRYLLENFAGTLVVDADGLTALSKLEMEEIKNARPALVLTPHAKEFSRLCGKSVEEILSAPAASAEAYAAESGAIILLKGPCTVITDGKTTYFSDAGCAGMATAGSGDVLTGITAATAAYIGDGLKAAVAAAYINGRAGELAMKDGNAVSMIASDTVGKIKDAVSEILSETR